MSLLNYFKEITIGWKLSLFLLVFCVWPISTYLLFHFNPALFISLDLFKLTLLSSAIASPFMVINIGVSLLLTNTKDDDLKWGNTPDHLLSGTVAVGIGVTLWILSFASLTAFLNFSLAAVKGVFTVLESTFLVVVIWSKIIEDKRFKRKVREESSIDNEQID